MFYFVPLIAFHFTISALSATWYFLFGQVAIAIMTSGTALFLIAKTTLGKVITVVGIVSMGIVAWLASDVYVTYFFTVSFFPWVLVLLEKKRYRTLIIYSFLLGLIVEYGNFVRSFSGFPLLVGVSIAIICSLKNSRKTVLFLGCLFLGMMLVNIHIQSMINQRNSYLQDQRYVFEKDNIQHTFWHNIYMGLGFITNNKTLYFSDACSAKKVKQVNPTAGYLKPEYETVLRNEVLKLCLCSPHYVLRVFFAKLGVLIYYLLLFTNVGLLAAYYRPKPLYIELSYWGMMCISALPGILTIPNTLYLLGFISVAVLYGIHSIVHALNVLSKKQAYE